MKENTIIFSLKNRDTKRIERLAKSLQDEHIESKLLLIDFGSYEHNSLQYKDFCQKHNALYVKTYTEGLPWSRAFALNTGIQAADTPFVTTTDADMYFYGNPFAYIARDKNIDKKAFYTMSYWLPKNGNTKKAVPCGKGSTGGFQFISKKLVDELGGYDERIKFWGLEDKDWTHRLELLGIEQEWLPDEYRMYHQWHKNAEDRFFRAETARFKSMTYFAQNTLQPRKNVPFGKIITKKERPILELVNALTGTSAQNGASARKMQEVPFDINFAPNEFDIGSHADKILLCKGAHPFQRLNLSSRFLSPSIPLSFKSAEKLCKIFTKLSATRLMPRINYNFDFFYDALEIFEQNGLLDYYICDTLETVYLLWS